MTALRGQIPTHSPINVVCLVKLYVTVLLSVYEHFVCTWYSFSNRTWTHLVWLQWYQLCTDIKLTTIRWSFEPSLWPWLWLQQSSLDTRHSSLWWCTNQLHSGCKRVSISVDTVEMVISDCMSPHCVLDREDSKPVFTHDTLAHADASFYQVWLQ